MNKPNVISGWNMDTFTEASCEMAIPLGVFRKELTDEEVSYFTTYRDPETSDEYIEYGEKVPVEPNNPREFVVEIGCVAYQDLTAQGLAVACDCRYIRD